MEWMPESSLQEETLGNISVYDWHPQWHTGACSVYRVYNLTWEHSVMSGFPSALPHQMKRKRNTEVFTADLSIAPEAKCTGPYIGAHNGTSHIPVTARILTDIGAHSGTSHTPVTAGSLTDLIAFKSWILWNVVLSHVLIILLSLASVPFIFALEQTGSLGVPSPSSLCSLTSGRLRCKT